MQTLPVVVGVLAGSLCAQGPQTLVVPASAATLDAPSFAWVPGACKDLRHQTLVGANHLAPLVGHAITGLSYRRTADAEAFSGGASLFSVALSTSPNTPLECSRTFAANVGIDVTQVYQGPVAIPASPGIIGPAVPWDASNTVHVTFSQPFSYTGGTLCIDVIGLKMQGQVADWWMADAAYDTTTGSVLDIGPGCGPFANALGRWSWVSPRTLIPGSLAQMSAKGPEWNWAVAAVGPAGPAFPLSLINLGQPGCNAYLSDILFLGITVFYPTGEPQLQPRGGIAEYGLLVPNAAWVLGAQMTTQWLDLGALTSSNGVTWTIAPAAPTLDMALLDGVVSDTTGNVSVYLAHVLRFDYQ